MEEFERLPVIDSDPREHRVSSHESVLGSSPGMPLSELGLGFGKPRIESQGDAHLKKTPWKPSQIVAIGGLTNQEIPLSLTDSKYPWINRVVGPARVTNFQPTAIS